MTFGFCDTRLEIELELGSLSCVFVVWTYASLFVHDCGYLYSFNDCQKSHQSPDFGMSEFGWRKGPWGRKVAEEPCTGQTVRNPPIELAVPSTVRENQLKRLCPTSEQAVNVHARSCWLLLHLVNVEIASRNLNRHQAASLMT